MKSARREVHVRHCVSRRILRRGFTLVESVMSMLIVSTLLVAAMQVSGISSTMQYKAAERAAGRYLADGLLNDIRMLGYEDPNVTPLFGVEAGETTTSKANYDDVDDFNGWTESPPQERDGTNMTNFNSTWRRSVVVTRLNPSDLLTATSETGLKLITVNVYHNSLLVATRSAYRSKAP